MDTLHIHSRRQLLDALVIGAALFSMFFGAGNMIFPPFLGFQAGTSWLAGFLSYFLADIGLAMLAMFALIHKGGPAGITEPLGPAAGKGLLAVIALCLSLIIAVPRTAATTFELSIQPLTDKVSLPVFCLIFFGAVLALSLTESAVVDIVGKILTPLLFFGLLFAILCGIIRPIGPIAPAEGLTEVLSIGIASGYQTMDVFGSIFLGVLVLNSAANKGYATPAAQAKISAMASVTAGAGLLAVYLGLTYLGATASTLFPEDITHTGLLNGLIQLLLPGGIGTAFFGIVVGLACLTTAIALTSSTASFFTELSGGRAPYRAAVAAVCAGSAAVACAGVDQIIAIAGTVLAVVYPPVLVLAALAFFDRWLGRWSCRLGSCGALAVSLMETAGIGGPFIRVLPLAQAGFAWLVPALLGCFIGAFIDGASRRRGARPS